LRGGQPGDQRRGAPIVRVLAPLPKVALYPALLLLLGFGHESRSCWLRRMPVSDSVSTYYGASMVSRS
jgi:NitT/TauT family transport system permease protein